MDRRQSTLEYEQGQLSDRKKLIWAESGILVR